MAAETQNLPHHLLKGSRLRLIIVDYVMNVYPIQNNVNIVTAGSTTSYHKR